jgi:Actin-like ATPase involved in cell morphogenesis
LFSEQTIYIQIEKDLFKILHVQSGRTSKIQGAFSNQRLAIAHFIVAAEALKKGVFDVYPKSFLRIPPVIVMHQIFNSEGGLCEIEDRILREAALSAGAKQVFIWQGQPLSSSQLESKVYKKA